MKTQSSIFQFILAGLTAVSLGATSTLNGAQNPAANNGAITQPVNTPNAAGLPQGVNEVVRMYQAGVSKEVIIDYLNNLVVPYHVSADGILYLHSLGMPHEIIQAIVQREGHLQQSAPVLPPGPGVESAPAATASVPPPTPPIIINGSIAPDYDYASPDVDYGLPYAPPIVIGGWGWGHFGGYRGGGFGAPHGGFGMGHGGGGHR